MQGMSGNMKQVHCRLVESKTRTYHGRGGSGRPAERPGGVGQDWVPIELFGQYKTSPGTLQGNARTTLERLSRTRTRKSYLNMYQQDERRSSVPDADWMLTSTPTLLNASYASAHPCASTNKGLPCKPAEEQNQRWTRGSSAVYHRDEKRSSFLAADQCTDAYLFL